MSFYALVISSDGYVFMHGHRLKSKIVLNILFPWGYESHAPSALAQRMVNPRARAAIALKI